MPFNRLDWSLNLGIFFLFAAGIVSLASSAPDLVLRQLIWGLIGLGIIAVLVYFNWRALINYQWFVNGIYVIALLLLLLTLAGAPAIRGVRAWLVVGPLNIQTSELAKLALILVYSSFFAKRHVGIAHLKNITISFLYFLIPAGLVLLQPDLGSVIVLFGIWAGYLLVSGIRWKHLGWGSLILAVILAAMWSFFLRPYQKDRISAIFLPEQDPFGVNYSVIQSKIAIGSAGFWGRGFGQGSQVQLGFLPEAQTDFIFAAFAEEWGMLGGMGLILVFLWVMVRVLKIGMESESNFSRFFSLGTAIVFLVHFGINLGSNLGLLPVIGIPLPFVSYGGSNLLFNAMLIGMLQRIKYHS